MKMVVLPRFLFLFTNIPIVLPSSFFQKITSLMLKLAWVGKHARVKWQTLTLLYHMVGLGAPDLNLYYRAAQCAHAYYWIHSPSDAPHICIEATIADPLPLPALMFQDTDHRTGILDSINSTRHAWHYRLNLQAGALLYLPAMPLDWAYWLPPCRDSGVTRALRSLKIQTVGDLFLNGVVKRWEEVQQHDTLVHYCSVFNIIGLDRP